jgi:hypothetical protein
MATTGTITINGLTDDDLIVILEEKKKGKGLGFNPANLQQVQIPAPAQPGQPRGQQPGYNGVVVTWHNDETLQSVKAILRHLLPDHPHSHPHT